MSGGKAKRTPAAWLILGRQPGKSWRYAEAFGMRPSEAQAKADIVWTFQRDPKNEGLEFRADPMYI